MPVAAAPASMLLMYVHVNVILRAEAWGDGIDGCEPPEGIVERCALAGRHVDVCVLWG